MRSKGAPTLYCWSGACGFLLGRFLDAQISQCLHQFSTSCLCLSQEYVSLTLERVFLIPKCPPVTILCNCVKTNVIKVWSNTVAYGGSGYEPYICHW
jgi:hypothetical protein